MLRKQLQYLVFCAILSVFFGCKADLVESLEEVLPLRIDLADSLVRHMYGLQQLDQFDSLHTYISSADPTYRYYTAKILASHPNKIDLEQFGALLNDSIIEIAQTAAFALGNTGKDEAGALLIDAFQNRQHQIDQSIQSTLLGAIGKSADPTFMDALASVETYTASDEHLIHGQAKALYAFMLRGHVSELSMRKMLHFLDESNYRGSTKVLAANYFSRIPGEKLSNIANALDSTIAKLENPNELMFLALAVGKANTPKGQAYLNDILNDETADYRVRINALRGLVNYPYANIKRRLHRALYDKDRRIQRLAADLILERGSRRYAQEYMDLSLKDWSPLMKLKLLGISNKFYPSNAFFRNLNNTYIRQRINEKDPYLKSIGIAALAQNPALYTEIIKIYEQAENQIIRSTCIQQLCAYVSEGSTKSPLLNFLKARMQAADPGEVYFIAQLIKEKNWQEDTEWSNAMQDAWQKMKNPEDIEAMLILAELLGKPKPTGKPFIGMELWNTLAPDTVEWTVDVTTEKGTMTLSLLPHKSPLTCLQFVEYCNTGFYDNLAFHRVVPNFVIQTGCTRGDGFSSQSPLLFSEFSEDNFHEAGYVGMASAGPHTESSQWFVTHSATCHLDARYTVFGKLTGGFDVLHKIAQGDKILSTKVIKAAK